MTYTDPYFRLPDPHAQPGFYADVPFKRLVAFFLDLCIIVALSLIVVFATFGLAAFAIVFLGALIGFGYRVLTLAAGSATCGMRLMGIELRRHDGGRFTTLDALLHTGAFYLSFGVFPLQALSALLMLLTPRGQGLTDMLFGTVALNRRGAF